MTRAFLVRGMLVGILAGLLTFGFLKVYGEPQVDRAIAFETQRDEAKAAAEKAKGGQVDDEPELVSRPVQAGLGLFTAVMVYATAFGGLFGLAFAFAYGRVDGALTPQGVSILLAATGFIAIYLVPNLKYPANPPSVGEPDTIGIRTALYFVMIAISLGAMIGAGSLKRGFCAAFRRLECDLDRGGDLSCPGGGRRIRAAGRQRSAAGVPGGGALEIPGGLDRRSVDHVGDARPAVRQPDRARFDRRPAADVIAA